MSSYPIPHHPAYSHIAPAPPPQHLVPPGEHHQQAHGINIPSLAYRNDGLRVGVTVDPENNTSASLPLLAPVPPPPPPPLHLPHDSQTYKYEYAGQWPAVDPSTTATSSLGAIRYTTTFQPLPTTSRPIQEKKKKQRTQFSACRQCRSRRVKCDLSEKQRAWEKLYGDDADEAKIAQNLKIPGGVIGKQRAQLSCTNCTDRRHLCIDVFADFKAAKQIKRAVPKQTIPGEANNAGGVGTASRSKLAPDATGALPYGSSTSSASPGDGVGIGEPLLAQGVYLTDAHNQQHNQQYPPQQNLQQQRQSLHPQLFRQVSYTSNQNSSPEDIPIISPLDMTPPLHSSSKPVVVQSIPRAFPELSTSGWEAAYGAGSETVGSAFYSVQGPFETSGMVLPDCARINDYMPMEQQYMPLQQQQPLLLPAGRPSIQNLTTDVALSATAHIGATANSPQWHPTSRLLPKPTSHLSAGSEETDLTAIPELTPAFLHSPFYRRFHVQRPIIDPEDFAARYLSTSPPSSSNLGSPGFILCHVLYAWACSYGVDEAGELDVKDEDQPDSTLPGVNQETAAHRAREISRNLRQRKTNAVVRMILKEIDDKTVMRRQTWDGVRCMFLILPLTEYVSTPMERLAMYECAVAQVFSMCSLSAMNYDGYLGNAGGPNSEMIRIRLYWYSFVHEGITTGLKGGRLVLDEEDLEAFHATLSDGWQLVPRNRRYQSAARFATAPIRLAMACRLIHKALTGPKARRREQVSKSAMYTAWEALEQCWLEFDAIALAEPNPPLQREDIVRFSDGWKIFMFEAHNICREMLAHRLEHHITLPKPESFLSDLSMRDTQSESSANRKVIEQLHEIAKAKCKDLTGQILEIIRKHVGSTFFRFDASLVRDGTYYTAMMLANEDGTEEDVAICLQALSEMRWGFAKTAERSAKLRAAWNCRSSEISGASVQAYYTSQDDTLTGGHLNTSSGTASSAFMTISAVTNSRPNIARRSFYLPAAHTIIDDLSISGLGANPSGWHPLADTASLSASAADFIGMQQGVSSNGMCGMDLGPLDWSDRRGAGSGGGCEGFSEGHRGRVYGCRD